MEKSKTSTSSKENKEKSPRPPLSAMDKAKAVLSVWTEKRKPSEICRELQIKWVLLQFWQDRALEGMLQALEPRKRLERSPELSPRLAALLEKRLNRAQQAGSKLEQRLQRLQAPRNPVKKPTKTESNTNPQTQSNP